MNKKLRGFIAGKPLKILIGVVVAYLLFAIYAVNPLAQRILPWVAEKKLASRISVGQVKLDPFKLILTVDKLRLTRADGAPLAGFDRLQLDLESSGIFHWVWHLKDIRLTAPQVTLDIAPDGKFNWSELLAKLNEDKEPDNHKIPRIKIDHILIEKGDIEYTERNRPQPFKSVLQPLGLELAGISTLPEDRGDYLLAAELPEQGGTLKWKGNLAVNPVASNGAIEIEGIKLAQLMQIANQASLPARLDTGELAATLNYNFSLVHNNFAPLNGKDAPVPVASLNKVAVKLSQLSGTLSPKAKFALNEVGVDLPRLDFSMLNGLQLRFQGLGVALSKLELKNGTDDLLKLDQATLKGVNYDLAASQLSIAELSLDNGTISATRSKNGSLDWQGLVLQESPAGGASSSQPTPQPDTAPDKSKPALKFDIASVRLQHWKAAFNDQSFVHPLHAEIKDINIGAGVSNAGGSIAVSAISTSVAGVSVRSALSPAAVLSLDSVSLNNGGVSLGDSSVKLSELVFSGLQTQVIRDANKALNWQAILEQPAANAKPKSKQQPSAWKIGVDKIALKNGNVHIEDKSTAVPVILDVQNAALQLNNGSLDLSKALPVSAKFQIKQGGQFAADGKLALSPLKTDLKLKLDGLSLKPFSPYVNQFAFLKLSDGQVNVAGKLSLSPLKTDKTLTGQFAGGFSINNLALNEEPNDALFLGWKAVSSDSLKLGIAPNRLHMNELHITQPVGKFIIYEDKTLNIKRILRASAPAGATSATATASAPATAEPSNAAPSNAPSANATPSNAETAQDSFPIAVDRVSVQDGDVDFADLSLVPQFGTHINTLTGIINGLSSNPATTAQVELDGKVDEYGSVDIRGSVQPFHATDFTDLKLAFHNLEMNRLTPYSGKFAGRKIDSGKLSVDLEYKIKNRQLAGENKFVINKLRLGEHVDSPDAMNLPLDLAIAILEDSDGLIDLDLPISGSLDDPKFSYGKIVWKAIVNVLEKIATAPFRALGNLLGISSDKLEAVAFDPGKAVLLPPEQEKLKAVATAMSKRPSLALTITPAYDPAQDTPALQELATRRDVANELGLQLKEGEAPGPVDLNNPKVQRAVENLLKDRNGQGRSLKALDFVKDYFKKPGPEDEKKYGAMLQQLKATAKVTDADLVALAKERAANLQSYLVKNAGLAAERTSIAEPVKVTGDANAVKLKLALGLAKK